MLYAPNDEYAMLSSVDFITPVVDDPYLYGQIAAANALSDIFAMGGEVKSALNLLMWDNTHFDSAVANAILKGGLNKITESNALLLGGHTIKDKEQKYGLAVNGIAHKNRLWRNHTGYIGDMLVLTKPLGSGILTTAIKAQMFSQTTEVTQSMAMLNLYAARIAQNYEIHACTDITGFGLLGHLSEMLNPKINIRLESEAIPLVEEAIEFAKMGIIPGGSCGNERAIQHLCEFNLSKDSKFKDLEILLFDAQTSGGLVFALPQKEANALLERLKNEGIESAQIIGHTESFLKDSTTKARIFVE